MLLWSYHHTLWFHHSSTVSVPKSSLTSAMLLVSTAIGKHFCGALTSQPMSSRYYTVSVCSAQQASARTLESVRIICTMVGSYPSEQYWIMPPSARSVQRFSSRTMLCSFHSRDSRWAKHLRNFQHFRFQMHRP